MEIINQYTQKTNWLAYIFGSIAGLGTSGVIVLYAFGHSNPAECRGLFMQYLVRTLYFSICSRLIFFYNIKRLENGPITYMENISTLFSA